MESVGQGGCRQHLGDPLQPARELAQGDEHAAEQQEDHEQGVDHGQVHQGLEGAGQSEADAAEGDGPEDHGEDGGADQGAGAGGPPRVPPEGVAHGDQHHRLEELDGDDGDDLCGQQAGSAQRGGAQPFEDAVAALEAGADAEGGHRRRHDGQGQDARNEEVDRVVGAGGQHVHRREEQQEHHRDAQGKEDGLPVGEDHGHLGPQLGHERPHQREPRDRRPREPRPARPSGAPGAPGSAASREPVMVR